MMQYIGEKPPRLSPLMQLGVVYFFVLHFFLCLEWWQAEHPACGTRVLTAVQPEVVVAVASGVAAAALGVDTNSSGLNKNR